MTGSGNGKGGRRVVAGVVALVVAVVGPPPAQT